MPFQFAGASCCSFAAAGDLAGDDLPCAQCNALAGVAVADGVAKPRKNAPCIVCEGQRPDTGRGVAHPHPGPPLPCRRIPDRHKRRAELLSVPDIHDLHRLPLRCFQRRFDGVIVLRHGRADADDPVAQAQPGFLCRIGRAAAGAFHVRKADHQRPL